MLKKKMTQVAAVAFIAMGSAAIIVGCGDTVEDDGTKPGDPDRAKPKTTETKDEDKNGDATGPGGKGAAGAPEGLPPVPGK